MSKKFDLAALLQEQGMVSKLDTAPNVQMLDILLIEENEKNFFEVADVSDLAESIQVNGLLQPLVVRPIAAGRYRLIAGHRRLSALRLLATETDAKWQIAPCVIVQPSSDELEELMLIQTNTEARELGWQDKSKAAERVEAILLKLQREQGIELPGKMRAMVAKIIKTSESQLARAKVIKDKLIPAFQSNKSPYYLSDDMAYSLARLDPTWQQELYDHYEHATFNLTKQTLKTYVENKNSGKAPFTLPPKEPKTCYAFPSKKGKYQKCGHDDILNSCKHSSCCGYCNFRYECPTACAGVNKRLENHKRTSAWLIGQRCKEARILANLTRDELAVLVKETDKAYFVKMETGLIEANTSRLAELSKHLNISSDSLLGFPSGEWKTLLPTRAWPPLNSYVLLQFGENYRAAHCVGKVSDLHPFLDAMTTEPIDGWESCTAWMPFDPPKKQGGE